ncbi:MAG: hypothetical protein NVS2B12_13780 [Ktedonobacteraceae bacterium]
MEEQPREHSRHHRHHRHFGNRPAVQIGQGTTVQHRPMARPTQVYRAAPLPVRAAPYHLALDAVLPPAQMERIRAAGRLVFHCVGDTGGVKSPEPQHIVVMHMERDFDDSDPTNHPAFFYNLGDVVYYYGEAQQYYAQFYEPMSHYPAPVFAIPGNHDGETFHEDEPTLAAFVENFATLEPRRTKESGDSLRDTMTQPHVYWTLVAPFATFVGLYSNVPEGGVVEDEQVAWFESEMAAAPPDKALIVSVHHPIYSADDHHSGSPYIAEILDRMIQKTGRKPDIVLTAHVHNYQRFTRVMDDHEIPYIVAGSGGYWHLHTVIQAHGKPLETPVLIPDMGVTLESYCDDRHGYMRFEASRGLLKGEYFTVPRPQESWSAPAVLHDSFTIDLKQHRLLR